MAILDLRTYAPETIDDPIIDRDGREWHVYGGVPVRMIERLQAVQAMPDLPDEATSEEQAAANQASLHASVDALWALFARANPDKTREDLIDGFDAGDYESVIAFLSSERRMRQASLARQATPVTQERAGTEEELIPTPTSSKARRRPEA